MHGPYISPQQEALMGVKNLKDIKEVAKALGYGEFTTDVANLTQGGAGTFESLEHVITEFHQRNEDYKVLNSIPRTQAGNFLDGWPEVYDLGNSANASVSNEEGSTKYSNRKARRRYIYIKFFTRGAEVNRAVLAQPNFIEQMNQEDTAILIRKYADWSKMIYKGSSEASGGHEFDGLDHFIESSDWANFSGRSVIDAMNLSGLDDAGFSNPGDVEEGLKKLSQWIGLPTNANGDTPFVWMGLSLQKDVQDYKNFEAYQVLTGEAQTVTTGAVIGAFANPLNKSGSTKLMVDAFMPDPQTKDYYIPHEVWQENGAGVSPTLTLSAAVAGDAESRFDARFAGDYRYWVAAYGPDVDPNHYYCEAQLLAGAVTVGAGDKVTLTIGSLSNNKEVGYAIYRSYKNGPNDKTECRMITRIPRTGNSTTFVDLNRKLPGSVDAYVVNFNDKRHIERRYAFETFRVELPVDRNKVNLVPMAYSSSMAIRSRFYRWLGKICNLVPRAGGWSPLTGSN